MGLIVERKPHKWSEIAPRCKILFGPPRDLAHILRALPGEKLVMVSKSRSWGLDNVSR